MKHCKKSLYISTASELSKIEIIIKYINKIVYNNDKHDLLLLSGLDLNYILLQILTERLANDKFFCENISIKFNIIGILGRLILVDEELFEIIVDDHSILIDMMINDYLSSSNLKFQQCMTFFLNSLLVAAQQYNNAAMKEHHIDVEEEKARKLAKIIYIDKLPILLSKFNDILQANDKLYPGSTQEDQVTMRMVKISIFEIMNSLIRGRTQFDKFQCIQYMCLSNYLEVLVTASSTPQDEYSNDNQLLENLALKGIYNLVEEYAWLLNNKHIQDNNDQKISPLTNFIQVLLDNHNYSNSMNAAYTTKEYLVEKILVKLTQHINLDNLKDAINNTSLMNFSLQIVPELVANQSAANLKYLANKFKLLIVATKRCKKNKIPIEYLNVKSNHKKLIKFVNYFTTNKNKSQELKELSYELLLILY